MAEDASDDDRSATAADGGTGGSGIGDASSDGGSEGASEEADYEDERVDGSASESDDAPDGATEVPTITAEPADEVDRARRLAADADRVVVKAGTNSLTDDASNLDRVKLDKLVADIMDLVDQGTEVLLVSSGAIGAGKGSVDADPDTVEASQALSTVGQSDLMHQYTESFDRFDRDVAQLLLTDADLNNPERYTNVRNTVETLLSWDVVPIVNENDAVATEEIEIGDNDMLSSSVALCVDADLLVLLTDVDAVYTGNPKEDDGAERIEAVGANYDEIQALVEASASDPFGGIRTKVEGARRVSEHGIPAIVAGSATTDVLADIGSGKPVGTIFLPVNGGTDD